MFCAQCGTSNDDAARFCAKCGAALAAGGATAPAPDAGTMRGAAPPPGAVVSSGKLAEGKNPAVALVISIFLGALGGGQFYNGDWKKGLTMAAASLLLGVATGGLVSLAMWVWSMLDSYQVASRKWKRW